MTSAEQELAVAIMSRSLRGLRSLDNRGVAYLTLIISGFRKSDVTPFLDRAIDAERQRRIGFRRIRA